MTENSTKSYLNRRLDDLAGYSTLHGFHFVIGRHFVLRRIIWTILLLIGILLFGLQLQEGIVKLTSYKTTISKEIDYSSELKFPAFTLCNVNMMKKSKILGTDSQYFLDLIDPYKSTAVKKEAQEKMNASFDIEQAVRENGHKVSDMVLVCHWMNEHDCDHRNFTTFLSDKNGLCHTFNSGKSGSPILRSNKNSKDDGLTLLIDVEPLEYYGPFSYLSTGVQVMIHDQDVPPHSIRSYGIEVMPGVTTYLQLKKQKIISRPLPYKSACGIRKLQTSKIYSKEACLFECNTRLIIQNCGCRYLGMPNFPDINKTKHCSPKEITECSNRKDLSQSMCDCPIPCEMVVYKVHQNQAYFPSPSFWPILFKILKRNVSSMSSVELLSHKQDVRQAMMIIRVSFQDLSTEVITENPAYDLDDLIADVGGILGLFLGCSLLTMLEFVDFLFVVLFGALNSKTKIKVKTDGATEEEMQGKRKLEEERV